MTYGTVDVERLANVLDAVLAAKRHESDRTRERAEEQLARGRIDAMFRYIWGGTFLDRHQRSILRAIFRRGVREVFIKGAAKTGKGTAVAIAAIMYFLVHRNGRVIVTSSSYDHAAQRAMFPEIAKWWRRGRKHVCPDEWLLSESITPRPGSTHTITVANPARDESFSGQHSPHTLFVFDEATGIPEQRYEIALTQAEKFVALSNPRRATGWFRKAFGVNPPDKQATVKTAYGKRVLITVDAKDVENVRTKKQVVEGQITYEMYLGHTDSKLHEPWWIECYAHGRFPEGDPSHVLFQEDTLRKHMAASEKKVPVVCFGLDVARSDGGDSTVLAAGGPAGCRALYVMQARDTMHVVGEVLKVAKRHKVDLTEGRNPICIDAAGLGGGGCVDRLKERGVWVIEYSGASAPKDRTRYANMRAEVFGMLAERLRDDGPYEGKLWPMPDDEMLAEELMAHTRLVGSDWPRLRIVPKHEQTAKGSVTPITKEIGRSPDRADAVAYLYYAAMHYEQTQPLVIDRPLVLNIDSETEKTPTDSILKRLGIERDE